MVQKTQYTFDIGTIFTPEGFEEEAKHVATSWQISDYPEFGDDGRAGERDFLVYESLVDFSALKSLKIYAEDIFQPFQRYWLRAKYHSNVKTDVILEHVVLKCSINSDTVEILGIWDYETRKIVANPTVIEEIGYAMSVDLEGNLRGFRGGEIFPADALVIGIDKTNATLTLSKNAYHSGAYIFSFSETFESGWSEAIEFSSEIGIWAILSIDAQPSSTSVYLTETASFSVSASISDDTELSYQWQIRNTFGTFQNIVGATSTTLEVTNTQLEQSGSTYRCIVSSVYNQTVISNEVVLTVSPLEISIFRHPRDQKIIPGSSVTFNVVASINPPIANFTYQWQKQEYLNNIWTDIPGAINQNYTTPALSLVDDFGDKYRVIVGNDLAATVTITSNSATLIEYDYDITLSPAYQGISNWIFAVNGPIRLSSANSGNYVLTPDTNLTLDIKMWGHPTSQARGGFTQGRINVSKNVDYLAQINVGGGAHGTGYGWPSNENGGGYVGLFNGVSASQGSAIMIAGGAGGTGYGHGSSSGGTGGGSSGSAGTNSNDSQIGSTGGGGGTQSGPGGGGGAGGSSGSALQGGRGGNGSLGGYPNAGGGGGGGGGYYGGGGGGGGNDYGQGTRNASGGGGGSGYVNTSQVTDGITANVNAGVLSEGGQWDDIEPYRFESAGATGAGAYGGGSLILIQNVLGLFYTDAQGRYLIFSISSYLTPPASLTKTFGTVFPGDDACIDNGRWQAIRNAAGSSSSTNYRIQYTPSGSKKPYIPDYPPVDYNIALMKSSNVISLATDLTQWGSYPPAYQSSFYQGLTHFSWSEDALASYAGNLWGYGSDYTGLTYGDSNVSPNYYQNGFSAFSHSNNGTVKYFRDPNNPTYSASFSGRTLEMWILPPGVPHLSGSGWATGRSPVTSNPACDTSAYNYGIFTRSGGSNNTFPHSDIRQLVVIWAGVVLYNGDRSIINPNDNTITIGDYTYEAGSHRGSDYGWNTDGVTCGQAVSPYGDIGNSFDIQRWG